MNLRISTVLFGSAFAGMALLTLIDAAAKGFALFAVAALVALLLRRASAATRHIVWVSALACALVLPCCAWLLPQWRVLPAWMSWEEVPKRLAMAAPMAAVPVPLVQAARMPIPLPDRPPAEVLLPQLDMPVSFSEPAISGLRLNAHTVLLAWLGGAMLLLAPLFYSTLALWRISVRSRVVSDGPLAATMEKLQREIGLRRRIRLLLDDTDTMPMVWGIFRPRLLLPSTAISWAPSRLRGVMLHELAHLRRHDPLSILIAQLALAIHWFNPLAWLAVRQLRAEQERACDDYVLSHGVRASDYASDLLEVATGLRGMPCASAALTMAHPARLEGRIMGILDAARNRRALTRWAAFAAVLLAAAIALPLAMLRAEVTAGGKPQNEMAVDPVVPPKPAQEPLLSEAALAEAKKKGARGRILDLNGFVLAESADATSRRYPFQALAAHTLGYTSGNREARRLEGRHAVEKMFDDPLRKGEDVQLSLDARLQSATEKALSEADLGRGAVVILDPATGEVRAMASTPNYDINSFAPAISVERWKELQDDITVPLMNRTLQAYTPGSTYHLVVAIAACRTGKAHPTFNCAGTVTYGTTAMRCWISSVDPQAGGHGRLNLREALLKSCSCYFYQLGNAVGISELEKTARDLGLGQVSTLGLAGENPGLVPSPAWLRTVDPNLRWSSGFTANVSVGQGSTLVTPLQMATAAAALANGGRVLAPRLTVGDAPVVRHDLTHSGVKPEHLEMLRASMVDGVQEGTGRSAKSRLISIAGRTGTSQSWRTDYEKKKIAENIAWFVGYAPADAPRYAFAVLVEGGKSGGAAAAPLARQIMEAVAVGLPAPEPQPESDGYFEIVPPNDN